MTCRAQASAPPIRLGVYSRAAGRIVFYIAWLCPHGLPSLTTCEACGRSVTHDTKGA